MYFIVLLSPNLFKKKSVESKYFFTKEFTILDLFDFTSRRQYDSSFISK